MAAAETRAPDATKPLAGREASMDGTVVTRRGWERLVGHCSRSYPDLVAGRWRRLMGESQPAGALTAHGSSRAVVHFEIAEWHVATAVDRIAFQESVVAQLPEHSRGREVAEELLATTRRSLDLMLVHRETVRRELEGD